MNYNKERNPGEKKCQIKTNLKSFHIPDKPGTLTLPQDLITSTDIGEWIARPGLRKPAAPGIERMCL